MKLSVIIPAHNEEDHIEKVITEMVEELEKEKIDNELIIVNDHSTDSTPKIAEELFQRYKNVRILHRRDSANGFGMAVKEGLDNIKGDAVVIAMGDASDDPKDIIKYFHKLKEGYDCVFGSRFIKGSIVKDYPIIKLIINRLANTFIQCLFLVNNNDMTNAFKAYRKEVIDTIKPIRAVYFNITVELPLKSIIYGFKFCTVPINWYGRESGVSKFSLRNLGRRYLYTVLSLWLEKVLIRDELKVAREK